MEEYLKVLMEQIRCKKAHPYIKQEILGHLEEQIEDNMSEGMSREEAERAAVADMGSPVEAGIALDKVHRPKMNWGVVGLMAIISIAGIVLHELMWSQLGLHARGSLDFVQHTLIGFGLMLVVYRLDYSLIARFSKVIAAGMLAACLIAKVQGNYVGGTPWLQIIYWDISLYFPMLLYVPIYGAVIYKYYGQGYSGLWKAILWMMIPVVLAFELPMFGLALVLLFSMLIVLTIALVRDWFRVAKKKVIATIWGCCIGIPALIVAVIMKFDLLMEYQIVRLKAFFTYTDNQGANYMTWKLRDLLGKCQFIGSGDGVWAYNENRLDYWGGWNTQYIFSYVMVTYGILAGILLVCMLALLIFMIFRIAFKQKNQLAMLMGCGCGMVIGLNVEVNIAQNLGLLPIFEGFLPFFSKSGGGILVCYIMMGIILSIYRYKNIYPRHVNTKLDAVKLTIQL